MNTNLPALSIPGATLESGEDFSRSDEGHSPLSFFFLTPERPGRQLISFLFSVPAAMSSSSAAAALDPFSVLSAYCEENGILLAPSVSLALTLAVARDKRDWRAILAHIDFFREKARGRPTDGAFACPYRASITRHSSGYWESDSLAITRSRVRPNFLQFVFQTFHAIYFHVFFFSYSFRSRPSGD